MMYRQYIITGTSKTDTTEDAGTTPDRVVFAVMKI